VRAEEIKCRERLYTGAGDHKAFRAGSTFQLSDHPRADFNAEYLLTEVRHHLDQVLGLPWASATGTTYRNQFVAIPKSQTFRPERKTEWPSIHGFMHAKIDAGGSGQTAEIDDQGRYKVLLPFDLSGKSGGKASRYVRMMQPYAGGGMGMHFPLHKGTEVLLGFLDGDPDRPIILGAVPNPETGSPVTGKNQSQCKIHTGGGNSLTIEDTDGTQSMKMHTPAGNTSISIGKG
jgi:type VI secretion system secreted protein VgrG